MCYTKGVKDVLVMGVITRVEQQKRNRTRYSIYIDNVFAFGLSEEVMVAHYTLLKENQTLDPAFVEQVLMAEEKQRVFESAVNLLSFKARSEAELYKRLLQRGYEVPHIDEAMEKLRSYGYLNDAQYARSYAKDQQHIKKQGIRGVKQALKQRGIEENLIQEVIEEVHDKEAELDQAISLCEKKARQNSKEEPIWRQKQRWIQFLVRKGYAFDIAQQAANTVMKRTPINDVE